MGNQNSKRPSSKGNRNSAIVDPSTPHSHLGSTGKGNGAPHSGNSIEQKQQQQQTNGNSAADAKSQKRSSKDMSRGSWLQPQGSQQSASVSSAKANAVHDETTPVSGHHDQTRTGVDRGASQGSATRDVESAGAGTGGAAKLSSSVSSSGEQGSRHLYAQEQSRHSLDTITQRTNGSHHNHIKDSSSRVNNHPPPQIQTQIQTQTQTQRQALAEVPTPTPTPTEAQVPAGAPSHPDRPILEDPQSKNDTHSGQSSPPKQTEPQQEQHQPSYPAPSIPFAVASPGNPILVKKHPPAPLNITSSYSSPHHNRSPPPPQPSPKAAGRKSQELSPTARLSFLGPGTGDKNNSSKNMDIDDMISRLLDAGYSGKISKSICLKNSEILFICHQARDAFLSQPTLIELNAPVKIVGDIHGQYTDLLRLFEMCGFPPSANFLFLGDYVDRGRMSLETILLLFCYKIKYPENFFLLRGNHECANVTKVYGFYDECKRRASIKMWKAFVDVFNCLPLAGIVANKIFCVHGGLSPSLSTMDDIRALRRPTDVPDYGLLNDLLWSDPSDTTLDWEDNERGVSYCFGRSIIQKFLNKHDFDLVCRAHMVVEDGYEFFNDRTLVTVFSAPNYCGEFDNFGAVMSVNEDLLCSFELLKPIDQATARAQMQILAASSGGWRVNKQRLSIPDSNSLYGSSRNSVVN
ncbi:hypothetical protein EC968_000593 [Mortierella alpina]|nr:hypothetical protein EC968_000593 [Mortierella alpina]